MAKLKAEEIARVKAMGFLWNRDTELFSARAITGNGVMTADQLHNLADCAAKYGNGTVAFTARLTVEMPGVPLENVEAVQQHVAQEGMIIGGTGAKVRPVVACKGTTCVYGNCDTQGLAQEIHERYFLGWSDVRLPHKFKIAVGGCPNSCMKPNLNDFGIEGHRAPQFNKEKCRGCKKCVIEARCPMNAAKMTDGALRIDQSACTTCGVCAGKCPFGSLPAPEQERYRIYVGGTWGKHTRVGTALPFEVRREEIFPLLEKTMLWFKKTAYQKERLGAAVDRVGLAQFEADLQDDALLRDREAIVAAPVLERH